ncbi:putative nuclease HARBI1 [Myzus persicae]|uniref:putative nuclease HARBI1 n=1 Tax=Myzus persicae TaxID=13164 RepID=UPI000B92FD71|nr:putative nuclease HARBI1 [Myzus persicae]
MANFDDLAGLFAIGNLQNQIHFQPHPRVNRQRFCDAFEISDAAFIKNFRLSKDLAKKLIKELDPYLKPQMRSSDLDSTTKVLIALDFYATGCYQTPVGNSKFFAVSQPSVSRCLKEVTSALNNENVFFKWVKFPSNLRELRKVRSEFYMATGFQGCIGCIDCTHVAIVPPSKDPLNANPEYIYVNRKGYHSINVQLICDVNLKIMNVNALFPGSTNDAYIWSNSNVQPVVKELYDNGHKGYFLLGDSGYPLRPWLLTPINNPITEAEKYYNTKHMSTRSLIERCNGVLKMRFRCLLKHRFLHYHPKKATQIINACTILHNMCITYNIPLPTEEDLVETDMGVFQQHFPNVIQQGHDLIQGKHVRSAQ